MRTTLWIIWILVVLALLSPLLLLAAAVYVPYYLYRTKEPCRTPQSSEVVVKGGEDDFAKQIERLCTFVIAEREKAYQNNQINVAVTNDKISYSVRMSASELKRRMTKLGFECMDMPKYNNRIGCGKRYHGYDHRYSVSLTFDSGDGAVSFFSGGWRMISKYL